MGHYDTNVIALFAGGVFSDVPNMREWRRQIRNVACRYYDAKYNRVWNTYVCKQHNGFKGAQVVIAGVFNFWEPRAARRFAMALSRTFPSHEVTFAGWCENDETLLSGLFLDGREIAQVREHPITRILRRVSG